MENFIFCAVIFQKNYISEYCFFLFLLGFGKFWKEFIYKYMWFLTYVNSVEFCFTSKLLRMFFSVEEKLKMETQHPVSDILESL